MVIIIAYFGFVWLGLNDIMVDGLLDQKCVLNERNQCREGRMTRALCFLALHMCLVSHFDDGRRLSHTCFETRGPIVKFAQCRWLKMKEGIALFQDPSLTVVLVPKWMVKAQDVPSCGNFQSLPLPGLDLKESDLD